jgi:hypothetical protein
MLNFNFADFQKQFQSKIADAVARTLEVMAIVILHSVTVPSVLSVMQGITDKLPPADLTLLLWLGLFLLFARAAVKKDQLMMVVIGVGFIVQAVMLALLFFH